MNIVPASKPIKGGSKTQNGPFSAKRRLFRRKSGTKFLCVKTVKGKVVTHSLAYLTAVHISAKTDLPCDSDSELFV